MHDFLIDTDTASDDAVALIMAMRLPGVVVRGITCVAGNVGLSQAASNAMYVTELCESDVPVFRGCERPMLREAVDASWFHGRDGLSDRGFAPVRRSTAAEHAVDAIIRITGDHPGLTLVTLGPLTNVATALLRDPGIAKRVGRCVIMGGNPCCVGNVTPAAEYNIWCDPEAAEIVLRSGMSIDLIGWHLCRDEAALNPDDIAKVRSIGTATANFAIDCNETAMAAYKAQTGAIGISLPDPTAMAVAIHPEIATHVSVHRVSVECHSELGRGQTIVDQLNVADDARNAAVWAMAGRARVIWSIDVNAFKATVFNAMR